MKDLKDLLELVNQAITENDFIEGYNHWFIDYSGHVNTLRVRHYEAGWSIKDGKESRSERCEVYLTPEGIQEAYWFIKNRLKNKN
tara:strand:- start:3173 stop:3427 length:255 start_codon:yes stop_codon:yes gene_type:complete